MRPEVGPKHDAKTERSVGIYFTSDIKVWPKNWVNHIGQCIRHLKLLYFTKLPDYRTIGTLIVHKLPKLENLTIEDIFSDKLMKWLAELSHLKSLKVHCSSGESLQSVLAKAKHDFERTEDVALCINSIEPHILSLDIETELMVCKICPQNLSILCFLLQFSLYFMFQMTEAIKIVVLTSY